MVNTLVERKQVDVWSAMAAKYADVGNYWEDVLDEISETIINGGSYFETPLDLLPLIEELPDAQMEAAWDAFVSLYPDLLWPEDREDDGFSGFDMPLREFIRLAWPVADGSPFNPNWHIDCICEHLEACTYGQITRLLINIPPGHAKSMIVSVIYPAWQWLVQPRWRMLCASYGMEVAMRDAVRCRTFLESDFYQESFTPSWSLLRAQKSKRYYINTRTGSRFTASVGSAITGFRGDALLFDDLMNAMDAFSPKKRHEATTWLDQAASNRLNDLRTGVKVMIAQRLHDGDPCGHVLKQGGWEHVMLPSRFEKRRQFRTLLSLRKEDGTPKILDHRGNPYLYGTDIRTEEGEPLFEERFPAKVIAEQEHVMGPPAFAGQYQQNPAVGDGALFKAAMFCPDPLGETFYAYPHHLRVVEAILSMDNAVKASQANDFTALCLTLLCSDGFVYLVPLVLSRMELNAVTKTLLLAWAQLKLGESLSGSTMPKLGDKLRYARLETGAAGTAVEQAERLLRVRAGAKPTEIDFLIAAQAMLKKETERSEREIEACLLVDALNPPEGWTAAEWELYRRAGLIQLTTYAPGGRGDILERASRIAPFCGARNVRLVEMAGTCNVRDWLGQLVLLPNGEHDDAVQSTIGGVEPFIGVAVTGGRPVGGEDLLAQMRGEASHGDVLATLGALMAPDPETKRRETVEELVLGSLQAGNPVVCSVGDWAFVKPLIQKFAGDCIDRKDVVRATIAMREVHRLMEKYGG